MSDIHDIANKLKSEGEKFYSFFAALSDEQWEMEVYTEGETWKIRNVLAHFVTSERGLLKLFERIRSGGEGASEDFSIDRYNARQQEKSRDLSLPELLEQYKSVRSDAVAWTLSLTENELEIMGRHPFLGMTTIREMLKMLYIHNITHYRDVKKALR